MTDEDIRESPYTYPTEFLGGPEDIHTGVVDYDGETLRVAYRKTRGNRADVVRFDFQGQGPLILSVSEARRFLNNALRAISRGEEKTRKEREDGTNK